MIRTCLTELLAAMALAALLFLGCAPAVAQGSTVQDGVTFGVGRLSVFATPSTHACAAACERDRRCRAWTFQRPQYDSAGRSLCHLHQAVYERSASPCCISGVIRYRDQGYAPGPGPGPGYPGPGPGYPGGRWQSSLIDGVTFGVGNYRYFDIPGQDSGYCRDQCGADPNCRAWTYQRINYNSRGVPVCHLHRYIGERTPSPCCVSGVVRRW
jgi:hypothetical protein